MSGVNRRRTTGGGASRVLFWLRREPARSRPAREIAMVVGARGLRGGPSGWWRGWCGRTSPLGSEAVDLVDMAHQPGAEASAATLPSGRAAPDACTIGAIKGASRVARGCVAWPWRRGCKRSGVCGESALAAVSTAAVASRPGLRPGGSV